jgi:hypothetical protein
VEVVERNLKSQLLVLAVEALTMVENSVLLVDLSCVKL